MTFGLIGSIIELLVGMVVGQATKNMIWGMCSVSEWRCCWIGWARIGLVMEDLAVLSASRRASVSFACKSNQVAFIEQKKHCGKQPGNIAYETSCSPHIGHDKTRRLQWLPGITFKASFFCCQSWFAFHLMEIRILGVADFFHFL